MKQVIIQLDHERRLVVYAEGGCQWEFRYSPTVWCIASDVVDTAGWVRDLAIAMGWAQTALINLLLPDEDAADASDVFLAQPPGVCAHEFHQFGIHHHRDGTVTPIVACQLCGISK